jgi:hypothetical protein
MIAARFSTKRGVKDEWSTGSLVKKAERVLIKMTCLASSQPEQLVSWFVGAPQESLA